MTRRASALALLAVLGLGCATPLALGEERYREGDRRGALEIWRDAPADDRDQAEIQQRISAVEAEFTELVRGYRQSAQRLEEQGRLAEAILDRRLALALQPDDRESWSRVQRLARELAAGKAQLADELELRHGAGDLEGARESLTALRTLDPFDPDLEGEERQLEADIARDRALAKLELSNEYQDLLAAGDLQGAQTALEKLLALEPDDPALQNERRRLTASIALEWRRQQQPPRTPRASQERADEVEGLIEAGRAAFVEERLETALVLWRQALRIDPHNERVQAYVARAERELERLETLREQPPGQAAPAPAAGPLPEKQP
jgi:tetratricopeptide (TPR) repeat protein